jgi:hypothetical protein
LRFWNLNNADLVVLSACETGLGGKLGDGIEILGFGYVMQEAGAKAAIASLWQVADDGTQALMHNFYTTLQQDKLSKAEALQKAQLALIDDVYDHLPILMIFILLISGCDQQINLNSSAAELKESESDTEARLIAVGDILMHMSVIRSGYNPKKKVYNFKNIFKQVKPIISTGDWAIANLETTVAGSKLGYSGYPLFNAPAQIVDTAKWAGFNVLTTANNHTLDKGEKGLINTIKNIRARGVVPVGTATSPQEASKILIIKKKIFLWRLWLTPMEQMAFLSPEKRII